MKNKSFVTAFIILVVIAGVFVLMLVFSKSAREKNTAEASKSAVESGALESAEKEVSETDRTEESRDESSWISSYQPAQSSMPEEIKYNPYAAWYDKNNDFIGWIQVDGTDIDYPVMQTPGSTDYYLSHDFDKQESETGIPHLAESIRVETSHNLIIFGGYGKNGEMFGALENFKNESFYDEYRLLSFNTFDERNVYEIFSVIETDNTFTHAMLASNNGEIPFLEFVEKCRDLSLYDTGVLLNYGDRLITLMAIDAIGSTGFVVVGKLIQ